MIWLFALAGLGGVFVLGLLFVAAVLAEEALERRKGRWKVRREVLAADWDALHTVLRLMVAHWQQTTALFEAQERELRRREGRS
ncbi:hypothetical protein AB0L41_36305 [Amycolatopsis mediterranei]|uniref:hypothetical protein n=1 Tax=Amycolatopsis mediterranei TaxID=33910 RepID=UPI0034401E23